MRNKRFKFVVRAARALVATVVVIVTVAFFAIRRAQRRGGQGPSRPRRQEATNARVAEKDAEGQRDQAVASEKVANEQRERAQAAEEQAKDDRDKAIMAKQKAIEAEEVAVKAKQVAVAAEQAEAKLREQEEALRLQKEYDAYIASIGLVAAKIDENAFGYAQQLLNESSPTPQLGMGPPDAPLPAKRADIPRTGADRRRQLLARRQARRHRQLGRGAAIWDVATGQPVRELKHGRYVHAVAYSPDGSLIATGSNDKEGESKSWDAETGGR